MFLKDKIWKTMKAKKLKLKEQKRKKQYNHKPTMNKRGGFRR